MAIFHITPNTSRDVAGTAFGGLLIESGPGTLVVDANAFLISESGGQGARLFGSWTATINGTVEAVDPTFEGLRMDSATLPNRLTNNGSILGGTTGLAIANSVLTSVKNSGLIHGGDAGIEFLSGTLTLVNSGTIAGKTFAIDAHLGTGVSHITNSGVLIGEVNGSGGADTFTDFKKVGHAIKSGLVQGVIDLGGGDDHFNGGAKAEVVFDMSGADTYSLGGGNDTYFADGGNIGADTINGGKGIDTYSALGASFTVLINLDTKAHGVLPAQFAQGANVGDVGNTDKVIGFENVVGGDAADLLIGSSGANNLDGKLGTDDLIGLGGRDVLTGGADNDRFIFQKLSDSGVTASTRDLISDFTLGEDHMVLVDLEASVGHAFTFIGTQQFHHTAGELRQSDSGANTIVSGDTNGDGKADFSIELTGHFALTSGDFTL